MTRHLTPLISGLVGVVVGSVLFGGVVYAANGGSLLIGRSNSGTATTSLSNSAGTALSLVSKAGTPAFKVNSNAKVGNLNSDLLDGLDSTSFLRSNATAKNSAALGGQSLAQVQESVRSSLGLSFTRPATAQTAVGFPPGLGVASNTITGGYGGWLTGTVTYNCSVSYGSAYVYRVQVTGVDSTGFVYGQQSVLDLSSSSCGATQALGPFAIAVPAGGRLVVTVIGLDKGAGIFLPNPPSVAFSLATPTGSGAV